MTHARVDETLVLDIHNGMRAVHRSRDLSRMEQITAKLRDTCAYRDAMAAFAAINGWRETSAFYDLGRLGRSMGGRMAGWADCRDSDLLDHPSWFHRDRRYVAAAGQPYLSAVDIAEERARLATRSCLAYPA